MKMIDLRGKVFGRLVVVERLETKKKGVYWLCKCACGAKKVVSGSNLRSGHTKSCGCLSRDLAKAILVKLNKTKRKSPAEERFFLKTKHDEATGCINWIGFKRGGGNSVIYGGFVLKDDSKTGGKRIIVSSHRYAWELKNGPIPVGMCVMHKCDNPLCVNTDHLMLGTWDDNNKDRAKKGRSADTHGEKHPRARLTEKQAIEALFSSENITVIAKRFGVNYHTIHKLRAGNNWLKLKKDVGYVR